uniref:Uncharacterized protein n=1 Tax=Tetranychus urticae TaxID=32264 RepID=T1JW90_TETUR
MLSGYLSLASLVILTIKGLEKRLNQIQEEHAKATADLGRANEDLETRAKTLHGKSPQVSQAGEESESLRKMFEHRCTVDEKRLKVLESQLKEARNTVEEADKKCDEVRIGHFGFLNDSNLF